MYKKWVIITLVSLLLVLSSGIAFAELVKSEHACLEREAWDNYFRNEPSTFVSPEEFLTCMEEYILKMCELLHIEFKGMIKFKFIEIGYQTSAYESLQEIVVGYEPNNLETIIVHEMSHIIAPHVNPTMNEGMAVYMESSLGFIEAGQADLYRKVNTYLRENLTEENLQFYKSLIRGSFNRNRLTDADYSYTYLCGYSYIRFLVGQFGFERFAQYYLGGGYLKSSEEVFGRSEEVLLEEWLVTVQQTG